LARFDVIIASIHGRMKMDRKAMTARALAAIRNPFFKIWGHPLGRILLHRDPVDVDMDAILDALGESRVAIELNGDPYRTDLPSRWVRTAHARNLRFVLSTGAPSTRGMGSIDFAIDLARRGGLSRGMILNALPIEAFLAETKPSRVAEQRRELRTCRGLGGGDLVRGELSRATPQRKHVDDANVTASSWTRS
jgi:DNA polymerase (family 10)